MDDDFYTIKVPMYINADFASYCKDCDKADLYIDKDTVYANGDPYAIAYSLKCKNRSLCSILFKNLQMMEAKNDK